MGKRYWKEILPKVMEMKEAGYMMVAENIAIAKIKQEGNPVVSPKKINKLLRKYWTT